MTYALKAARVTVGGFITFILIGGAVGCGNPAALPETQTVEEPILGTAYGLLSAGESHVCVTGGHVKCWGSNAFGQLGYGDTNNRGDGPGEMGNALPLVDYGGGTLFEPVIAGGEHVCAMKTGGLRCWGLNNFGQLGLGDTNNRGDNAGEMGLSLGVVNVGTGRSVKSMAAGSGHTCAILDNNKVKCWGLNTFGQLGLGDMNYRGDNAGEMGDALPFVDLGTGRTALKIFAGAYHSCALLDNSKVKCWGLNNYGQLGQGDVNHRGDNAGEMGDALLSLNFGTQQAISLALGREHSCVVLSNKSIKCWGKNNRGQLGLGDTDSRGDGPGEMGTSLPVVDLGLNVEVSALRTVHDSTCARYQTTLAASSAKLKCWGDNTYGQLGRGDTATRGDGPGEMGAALPVIDVGIYPDDFAVGGTFVCMGQSGAGIKCWGRGSFGTLGQGDTISRGDNAGEMGSSLPFVDIGTGDGGV